MRRRGGDEWLLIKDKDDAAERFAEWTKDGKPAFLGLRDDKTPHECVREET
jgi:hypothetical protein